MSITNPKVAQVFAADSQQMKFVAAALAQLLGEEKTEALISEILPQEVKPSQKFKGQALVLFNGLSREQLKKLHGFSDSDVDTVAEMLGVTLPGDAKSDAEVNRAEIENAGTASERSDVKDDTKASVAEGTSEAEVDAARAQATKSAAPAKQAPAKDSAKGK